MITTNGGLILRELLRSYVHGVCVWVESWWSGWWMRVCLRLWCDASSVSFFDGLYHTKEYPEGYYLCAMEDSAKGIYSHSTVARTIILRPAVQATVRRDN